VASPSGLDFFDIDAGTTWRRIRQADEVRRPVWSPNDDILAVEWTTNTIHRTFELWDAARGVLLSRTEVTSSQPPNAMAPAFSADGGLVAYSGDLDGPASELWHDRPAVVVLNLQTKEPIGRFSVPVEHDARALWDQLGPPSPVSALFNPTARWLAVRWSPEEPLALWNLGDRRQVALQARGATYGGVVLSADERWLLWGEYYGVERWDLVAGKRGSPLSTRDKGFPFALGVHPRRPEVLVLTERVVVSRWDLTTGRRLWETALLTKEAEEVQGYIHESEAKVAFLPREDRVLVKDEKLYVLDARTGRVLDTPERDPTAPSIEVTLWNQPGRRAERYVVIQNSVTHEMKFLESKFHAHVVIEESEDHRRVVVVDPDDGDIAWYDLPSGERHVLCEAGAP
jgi:hypothetical protein